MMQRTRVGILGGTFDPIHVAHLVIAQEALEQLNLDKVLFIPTGIPSFKRDQAVTPGNIRFEMVHAAIASNPAFDVSDLEVKREGITYTVDTLERLRAHNPHTDLFFIVGSDALKDLPEWHRADELAHLAVFVGTKRPGTDVRAVEGVLGASGISFNVEWIDVPQLDISSSDLRLRVAQGRNIRYLVPQKALDIIHQFHLYEGETRVSE